MSKLSNRVFYLTIFSSALFLACCEPSTKSVPFYEEGKWAYDTKCISCHTSNPSGTYARPTLLEMVLLDSITVNKKFSHIKTDSINHQMLFGQLSDTTISDIAFYLKHFYRKQY
jgi:cytochrome c